MPPWPERRHDVIYRPRSRNVRLVKIILSTFIHPNVISDVKSAISPCGMCRQVIREFCAQDMPIFLVPSDYPQPPKDGAPEDGSGGVKETSIAELLPDSFGPEELELPRG